MNFSPGNQGALALRNVIQAKDALKRAAFTSGAILRNSKTSKKMKDPAIALLGVLAIVILNHLSLPSFGELVSCAGNLKTQLALLLLNAALWNAWITLSSAYFWVPFFSKQPWKERWVHFNKLTLKNGFQVDFDTDEEVFIFACMMFGVVFQHGVGGALCIPSVLGFKGEVVSALACHGALCEAGWELQDSLVRAHQVAFEGEDGKKKNPPPLMAIMAIHHAMGLSMCIPMNIYLRDNAYYHEFVFLLQFAACVALATQNYGFTLDVNTEKGLVQMKICTTITFVVMAWSRIVRFLMVAYQLVLALHEVGPGLLGLGSFVCLLMGVLNVLFVGDAYGKFKKFSHMHHSEGQGGCPAPCHNSRREPPAPKCHTKFESNCPPHTSS